MFVDKINWKKGFIVFILMLFNMACLDAQILERKVFSSVGGKTTSAPYYFSFTIGEPVIGTDQNTLPILTKGFEQPIDPTILEAIRRGQLEASKNSLSKVYPIPAHNEITLEYFAENEVDKKVYLINANGQILFQKSFQQETLSAGAKIDLSGLAAGSYWIICSDLGKKSIFPIRKE